MYLVKLLQMRVCGSQEIRRRECPYQTKTFLIYFTFHPPYTMWPTKYKSQNIFSHTDYCWLQVFIKTGLKVSHVRTKSWSELIKGAFFKAERSITHTAVLRPMETALHFFSPTTSLLRWLLLRRASSRLVYISYLYATRPVRTKLCSENAHFLIFQWRECCWADRWKQIEHGNWIFAYHNFVKKTPQHWISWTLRCYGLLVPVTESMNCFCVIVRCEGAIKLQLSKP